jgi:hypothetical protein
MTEEVNLLEQNEWTAQPDEELKIPEAYVRELRYEIIVFGRRKEFSFRCRDYHDLKPNVWTFDGVIIDTSKKNPKGEIQLKRLTYHPELTLVNLGFMVVPAPELKD